MRLLLIVNSSASSVTPRTRVLVAKALGAEHDVTVAETTRRDHATRLAQDAAAKGYEVVAALGGDGTLNEAANGLAGSACALAPLPGGSTNVFARTIGLPNDPVAATEVVLAALRDPDANIARVGLGTVNGRYFLFHTGIGFDAEVVHQVERRGALKRYLGHPLFMYATVATWVRHYDRSTPAFTVRHDGEPGVVDGSFTICLNTNPYTYLGNRPFDLTPDASLERALVVLTFPQLRLGSLVRAMAAALRSKEGLGGARDLVVRTDQDDVEVVGRRPFPYQVDGDYLGRTERLQFGHEPDALALVRPPPERPAMAVGNAVAAFPPCDA